jgi:hypothetical protein
VASDLQVVVDERLGHARGLAVRTAAGWFSRRGGFRLLGWSGLSSNEHRVGPWRIITGASGFAEGDPPEREFHACEIFFLACDLRAADLPRCSQVVRFGRIEHCGPPRRCDSLRGRSPTWALEGEGLVVTGDQHLRFAAGPAPAPGKGAVQRMVRLQGPYPELAAWCAGGKCAETTTLKTKLSAPFEKVSLVAPAAHPLRRHLAVRTAAGWFVDRRPLAGRAANPATYKDNLVGDKGAEAQVTRLVAAESQGDTLVVGTRRGHDITPDSPFAEGLRACALELLACRQVDQGAPFCSRPLVTARARPCYPHRQCQWREDSQALTITQAGPDLLEVAGAPFQILPAAPPGN